MLKEALTLDDLKKLGSKKITSLQNKRFRATLRYMLPNAAFYKELFERHKVDPKNIKTVEDWKKFGLPLIKKKLYLDRIKDFIVRPQGSGDQIFMNYLNYAFYLDRHEGFKLLFSALISKVLPKWHERLKKEVKAFFMPKMPAFAGGTESGRPAPVLLTAKQKFFNMTNTADISAYLVITRHFGEETITGMNLFPYAPHVAWQIINMAAELRADLNLCTAAGGVLSTEKLINIAKGAQPNLFSGMVDYLINIFLPRACEEGLKLGERVVFLNGATKMLEVQRRQVKEMFKKLGAKNVIALDGYGASELKETTLAECEEGSGFHHVAPLSSIIRTVKVGRADPQSDYIYDWDFTPGEKGGYAAIWNIDGAGTLLEGFLLGDKYDRIVTGKCPHCGLSVERVYNINRIVDMETEMKIMGVDEEKVKGTIVNLAALREKLLCLEGIREVQLVVKKGPKGDMLIVKYVPAAGKAEELKLKIKEVFKDFSDVQPDAIEEVKISDLYIERDFKYQGILRK